MRFTSPKVATSQDGSGHGREITVQRLGNLLGWLRQETSKTTIRKHLTQLLYYDTINNWPKDDSLSSIFREHDRRCFVMADSQQFAYVTMLA